MPHQSTGKAKHGRQACVYVSENVQTQTIQGFFVLFETGVRGVYHSISKKWLQGYLNEYA